MFKTTNQSIMVPLCTYCFYFPGGFLLSPCSEVSYCWLVSAVIILLVPWLAPRICRPSLLQNSQVLWLVVEQALSGAKVDQQNPQTSSNIDFIILDCSHL